MKKSRILIVAMGLGAVMMLMALAQDDQLLPLREAIANLTLRVEKLESGASGGGSANTSGGAPAPAGRSMVLVSVHIANVSQDDSEEIAQLQQQCGALMNTVNASADKSASDIGNAISNNDATYSSGGVSGWRGSAGGTERTAGGGMGVAQTAGDIETEQRYATLHAIKLKQLQQMQDAANTPKQILIGHDAQTIYTLNSKVDLSETLNNIPIGATVTWNGTRLSADNNSETWRIDSIKLVGSN
jgi:hypothetical protein